MKASLQADVRPQVDGILQRRLFEEGQYVQEGDVLYQIDPASYQTVYNQDLAALSSAVANIQASKLKAERYAQLLKHNGVSQQDYDDAQAAYRQALAAVEEKKAAARASEINLERTAIKAPISGYISISGVTPGALVTAKQSEALAVIRNLDPVYMDMTQSAAQLVKLRLQPKPDGITLSDTVGVRLQFEDRSSYEHKGKLRLQEVAADETTGMVTLRAEFPNPDGLLLPGMYVRARVNDVEATGILVDRQAVNFDAKGNVSVFVVDENNRVEQRHIITGPAVGKKLPEPEGLRAGERIITEGSGKVRAGQQVIPVDAAQ